MTETNLRISDQAEADGIPFNTPLTSEQLTALPEGAVIEIPSGTFDGEEVDYLAAQYLIVGAHPQLPNCKIVVEVDNCVSSMGGASVLIPEMTKDATLVAVTPATEPAGQTTPQVVRPGPGSLV